MSRGKRIVGICAILAMTLVLACAPKVAPAPQAPAPAAAEAAAPTPRVPTPAAPAKPAWEIQWERTIEAAKREGVVTFGISIGPATQRELSVTFKDKYGIRAEGVIGTAGTIGSKIVAERRAGLYLWDVALIGSGTQVSVLKPEGATSPLEPAFILPDLTDPEMIKNIWYEGKLPWTDRDRHLMPLLLYVYRGIVINTKLVKPGEIKSWDDLLEPKWKGKILLLDPTQPGQPADAQIFPMFYEVKGESWVRRLAAQEPVIIGDDRLANDWLAHEKYPIYVGTRTDGTIEFIKAGAPLAFAATADANILGSGPGTLSLINKAPHPNAARLFINWVLSKEGMTIMSKTREQQTPRLDVPTDFVPPEVMRQPGEKYWLKDREESLIKVPDYRKKSKEIFGHLIK